jgi:hypothetical protein
MPKAGAYDFSYVAWYANAATSIANVRFGMAFSDYLKGKYGFSVSASSNNNGLYATGNQLNIFTTNFTSAAGTLGGEIHQNDTRNAVFTTGTNYSTGLFDANDLIVLSTWSPSGSPQIQCLLSAYGVSGGVATFKVEYRFNLRSGSSVGADFHTAYLPYINITDTSTFFLISQRWLTANISSVSYGTGNFNFAKGVNFYY